MQYSTWKHSDQLNKKLADLVYSTAIQLTYRGFYVFPIHGIVGDRCTCGNPKCYDGTQQGKHPILSGGFKIASKNPFDFIEWYHAYPWANIAISTGVVSDLVVIDIDPRHGGDESLNDLMTLNGRDILKTVTVGTGGGGRHLWFRPPNGVTIKCSSGKLGPGIDVRGDNGYIISPPSSHLSGLKYRWYSDLDKTEIMTLPPWLIAREKTLPVQNVSRGTFDLSTLKGTAEGSRNQTATSVAGYLLRRLKDREIALGALIEWNSKNSPPLSDGELKTIFQSVSRYHKG